MAESSVSPLHIVRTQSLASLVADELERMILSGEIPPGTRLNEQALAARLGVSRGPVREAVRGLDRSGLVVTVVNQGSFVRQLSAEEAMDVYDLRVALTGYACERRPAAPRRSRSPRWRPWCGAWRRRPRPMTPPATTR
ncbi:GntR family transcriptional regulator [Teichococcus aestuarii]|uniref:GntR family transcriptional regulator n=1 Tax=Teichococcus aestuarii TaxID=568898 RepID=UPI00360A4B92